jgi:hypothetical protein
MDTFNNRVNFESLYGIWDIFTPLAISQRALMQLPKASKLLLIFAPSINLTPRFSVCDALSDPARSINDNFAVSTYDLTPSALSLLSTVI